MPTKKITRKQIENTVTPLLMRPGKAIRFLGVAIYDAARVRSLSTARPSSVCQESGATKRPPLSIRYIAPEWSIE
jgi:hypothetical protein